MGLYYRDYMREDDSADWWKPGYSIKRWLTIGILTISLLTSGLWFVRSTGLFRTNRAASTAKQSSTKQSLTKQSLTVNINSATIEELLTLPGVGPVRANAIIAHRPYATIDELTKVSGITDRQLVELRPFVKTDGNTEPARAR